MDAHSETTRAFGQKEADEGLNVLADPTAREGALAQLNQQLSEKKKQDLAQAEHNVLLETGAAERSVALAATDALRTPSPFMSSIMHRADVSLSGCTAGTD